MCAHNWGGGGGAISYRQVILGDDTPKWSLDYKIEISGSLNKAIDHIEYSNACISDHVRICVYV